MCASLTLHITDSCTCNYYIFAVAPVIAGLSDPYCRLGILSEENREKHVVHHKDLEDWQREKLVESIASTTIKSATLEPEWNEEVRL